MARNPNWTKDELILALDLYFQNNPREVYVNSSKITELSNILKSLPVHARVSKDSKFRNNNSVHLKLCNFLSLDPSYYGKGLSSIGQMDKKVWNEFSSNREKLSQIAESIKLGIKFINENKLIDFDTDEEFSEGNVLEKLHKYKERNPTLVKKKKELFIKQNGKVFCEICSFDFELHYGQIGQGFIECH